MKARRGVLEGVGALECRTGKCTYKFNFEPMRWMNVTIAVRTPLRWRTPARPSSAPDSARVSTPSTRVSHLG